jgi:CHAT domain-containing protein
LHVSAHGRTQSDRLLASGLWLNPQDGSNDPQFLSWADLFEHGVAADLVVLNACQLAQSDGAVANAALDFAAAVSRAGARDTIAAQWPVSDTASAIWVPAFYRALAAGGDRPDPAQALAEARRALHASRAFRHPFHWAGWVHWQRLAVGE